MIYGSILDVIKTVAPSSECVGAFEYYKRTGKYRTKRPNNGFYWVKLPNGLASALPVNFQSILYYRGENNKYVACESSKSRNCKSDAEKEIADIKVVEFELALKQFPQVYLAERDKMYIDYIAMAQHYGFTTYYLDLTNDIGVAAFFACTKLENNHFTPNDNEYAQIRVATFLSPDNPVDPANKLHIFGLQPFLRPARQNGSCFRLDDGEDFKDISQTYVFKTNEEDSLVIINYFEELIDNKPAGHSWLFPDEVIIPVADKIKNAKGISNEAIELYCSRYKKDRNVVGSMLNSNSYSIVHKSNKWITEDLKKKLELELTPYPYGQNIIGARLCYKPI